MFKAIPLKTPQEVLNYLWAHYQKAAISLGLSVRHPEFVAVMSRWEEVHRHYHTVEHLTRCLMWMDAWHADCSNQRLLEIINPKSTAPILPVTYFASVVMALFYHDAIYDVHAKDNEEQSAQLALRELTPSGDGIMIGKIMEGIYNLIDITKHNGRKPISLQEKLIIDADLSSFGGSAEEYKTNSKNIRKEYLWVDLDTFQKNRLAFLEKLYKSKEPLFHTDFARRSLNATAMLNIGAEITQLREIINKRERAQQKNTQAA